MLTFAAAGVLLLAAGYLIVLGLVALVAPQRARRFLSAFASTRPIHFAELAVRVLVGAALVTCAPFMRFTDVIALVGWMLIVTTALLLLLPWRWHRRFAQWAVPRATHRLGPVALGSLAGGGLLLYALVAGHAAPA